MDLLVPPGQLAIGEALIKAMYEKQPDLSALSQQQQLQLLQLADAYSVHKVGFAACSSLSKLSIADLEWNTATAVFDLPESCSQLEPFDNVKAAAVSKLQGELGDLDVVWSGKSGDQQQQRQQQLMGLPFAAIHQLLTDEQTKASSEDTVFYTMSRWVEANPASSPAQRKQLAAALRMPHCSPTYLASTVLADSSWLRQFYPCSTDLFRVCVMAGASSSSGRTSTSKLLQDVRHLPSFKANAAWSLPKRPVSDIKSWEMSWHVPSETLRLAFEAARDSPEEQDLASPWHVWQGREFCLDLEWRFEPPSKSGLGFYLMLQGSQEVVVQFLLRAHKTSGRCKEVEFDDVIDDENGMGDLDFFRLDPVSSWEAVQQKLQAEMVHSDGCLHLSVVINHLA